MPAHKGFYPRLHDFLGLRIVQVTGALSLLLSGQTTAERIENVQQRAYVMLQASACALQ